MLLENKELGRWAGCGQCAVGQDICQLCETSERASLEMFNRVVIYEPIGADLEWNAAQGTHGRRDMSDVSPENAPDGMTVNPLLLKVLRRCQIH